MFETHIPTLARSLGSVPQENKRHVLDDLSRLHLHLEHDSGVSQDYAHKAWRL